MAFQPPQATANRKLMLEQLNHTVNEKKKLLEGGLRGGHMPTTSSSTPSTSNVGSSGMMPNMGAHPGPSAAPMAALPSDAAGMTSQQRTALQFANAHSVGYFITQDSSFGNLILPVLPRYADK